MPFAHGANGLVSQTTAEIVAELEADFQSPDPVGFGPDFDVTEPEPAFFFIGIMARREASVQAGVIQVQDGRRKSAAVDSDLDNLAFLVGVTRDPATSSTVTSLRLGGTPATNLGAGRLVRHKPSDTQWSIPDGTIIGGGGTVDVVGTAVNPGPQLATTSAVNWEIVTAVSGWDTVESLADAVPGQLKGSNKDVRDDMDDELASAGRATVAAILANMQQNLTAKGVTSVAVFHNPTGATVGTIGPYGVEVVLEGGSDADIGEELWLNVSAGTPTFGTESYVVTDANGDPQTMKFSRVTDLDLWIRVTLTTTDAEVALQVGAAQDVEDAVLAYGLTLDAGNDVIPDSLRNVVLDAIPDRSTTVTLIEISDDDITYQTVFWPVGSQQKAKFDSARTTVVIV